MWRFLNAEFEWVINFKRPILCKMQSLIFINSTFHLSKSIFLLVIFISNVFCEKILSSFVENELKKLYYMVFLFRAVITTSYQLLRIQIFEKNFFHSSQQSKVLIIRNTNDYWIRIYGHKLKNINFSNFI